MEIRRRRLMRHAAGAAVGSALSGLVHPAFAATVPSLAKTAAARGLLYGSDSDVLFAKAPPEYLALFAQQCGLYAGRLDWRYVTPELGAGDPTREDPNISVAQSHGLKIGGGHLLWFKSMPKWFATITDPTAASAAVKGHIRAMCTRFKGQIYSWNVVNEAIGPQDGRPDGLRNTPLLATLGPGYISEAFKTARSVDPHALLVYNDYGFENKGRRYDERRDALLRLLDTLARDGAPIDGVGLQSHLRLDGTPFNEKTYRAFLHEIASRHLRILITELDVFDLEAAPDIAARDNDVAQMYSQLLGTALDEPAVCQVVTWGVSDRYTWLSPTYDPSYIRRDGQPSRPLPFDSEFQPKAAFNAILSAFQHAPTRQH